ncbi:Hypothetical protein, putative [Bodo saltans]|uniref:Uncharacterized protein n=1 Tax=Bodo saltans TaxID=75058 RepID=A0A0S4JP68_BODSA|nr:Hypothetical protein, putative [Bodo saltans]|eukprot:CUG93342.1 Hypothetical protein, putative [Bodo saltans]
MLVQLTEELTKLQSRLRDQSPSRQRITPQTSSAPSEVTGSPTQPSEPIINWPTRADVVDDSTQCGSSLFCDASSQCDILAPPQQLRESITPALFSPMTPARSSALVPERAATELPPTSSNIANGLVSTPIGLSQEDTDVPSLAREADRLLSVITKLRAERSTPQSIGKR